MWAGTKNQPGRATHHCTWTFWWQGKPEDRRSAPTAEPPEGKGSLVMIHDTWQGCLGGYSNLIRRFCLNSTSHSESSCQLGEHRKPPKSNSELFSLGTSQIPPLLPCWTATFPQVHPATLHPYTFRIGGREWVCPYAIHKSTGHSLSWMHLPFIDSFSFLVFQTLGPWLLPPSSPSALCPPRLFVWQPRKPHWRKLFILNLVSDQNPHWLLGID